MNNKDYTPGQFVKDWLPDYKERLAHLSWEEAFPEALAAVEKYVWERACWAQKGKCFWARMNDVAIMDAPMPEFIKTEQP